MYGLTSAQWKQIYHILDRHRDQIHRVRLFGSRARGDYRVTSDVDLAIENDQDIRSTLLEEFEQSNLPYTFDIVFYDHQTNEKLRDAIDRGGKLLFCVESCIY